MGGAKRGFSKTVGVVSSLAFQSSVCLGEK